MKTKKEILVRLQTVKDLQKQEKITLGTYWQYQQVINTLEWVITKK